MFQNENVLECFRISHFCLMKTHSLGIMDKVIRKCGNDFKTNFEIQFQSANIPTDQQLMSITVTLRQDDVKANNKNQ